MITELTEPLSVRRLVCFSSAIHTGSISVEGVTGRLATDFQSAAAILQNDEIPVLIDPELDILLSVKPVLIIDGRMLKSRGDHAHYLSIPIIGLGPGFIAGKNCQAVVETNRGPWLGRVIREGEAEPDTGTPERVFEHTNNRVLRSPSDGILETLVEIADTVNSGDIVGKIEGVDVKARFNGVVRGLLRNGSKVYAGMKIGDIDPRGDPILASRISDKALAIGGGVLEVILSDPILRRKLIYDSDEPA